MAIFKLPQDAISAAGALVVFFAGGGLVYAFCALYNESYQGRWEDNHKTTVKIMSIVFTVLAVALQIVVLCIYKHDSTFGLMNFFMGFDGNVGEFYLRLLSLIFSGLALYPVFAVATGQIDTSEYVFVRKLYYRGEEIKSEYITKSCDESKVAYFFTAVLIACVGLMASSLAVICIALGLNVGQFLCGKARKIPLAISILLAVAVTVWGVVVGYQVGDARFGVIINVVCELLPLLFAGLSALFFIGYFKVEWFSNVIMLIIATIGMVFISWGLSYLLGVGIINLFPAVV